MSKRVLIVNKFYYNRGGAEVVAMAMRHALQSKGYETSVYTMDYENNFAEENCFLAPEVTFKGGLGDKVRFAMRTLGGYGLRVSFSKALNDFKPDVVHFHNIHSYLAPAIVKIAKDFGCKIVWTLHDYKLLCPAYACLRDDKPCELCFHDKRHVIKYRCMKDNLPASILAYVEAKRWNRDWIEKYVDAFVCPSQFIAGKMVNGGFNKSKLNVVCNFVDPAKYEILKSSELISREDYYVYVGRLSQEKGVNTLLEVASTLPYKLKVAGGGSLLDTAKLKYEGYSQIEFLGHQNAEQVSDLLSKACFTVVPSECYENNPLSVIESLCAGTPVIGAKIGGIPELISEGVTGCVYTSGDQAELRNAIEKTFKKQWNNALIKTNALERFSAERHISLLEGLYK